MQTHVEFAAQSISYSRWAAAYYQAQKNNGSGHYAAVRALAYKWDRIIFRCWKDRKPYDESKYIEGLKRGNSPLIKLLNLTKPAKRPKLSHSSWTSAGDIITEFRQKLC